MTKTLSMGGKMKLLTYQPLVTALLFTLFLSGLSGDTSASDISTATSNKVIVSLPNGELTEKTLQLTVKMDVHENTTAAWHFPIDIYVFAASENFRMDISLPLSLDETYYESTVQIPKEYIESWSAMEKNTVEVWLKTIYEGSSRYFPRITLVGASFVNSSSASPTSTSADEPVKREGQELIVPLPDDELAGKSFLFTFGKTPHPIPVHSIEIYASGELITTMGPYKEPYKGEDYETMAIPIPEKLLKSWSAMKLREVTVWPVFTYIRQPNPGDIDPPLINVAIINTSTANAVDDDDDIIIGQEENYCAQIQKIWTPKDCLDGVKIFVGEGECEVCIASGFKKIEEGSFTMGSPLGELHRDDDEGEGVYKNREETRISSFYIMTKEVSQIEYFLLRGKNPAHFKRSEDCDNHITLRGVELCPTNPAENLSWDDAQAFIGLLNNSLGLENCHHAPRYISGCYRLLTEAEWEYVARGGTGTTTADSFGVHSSVLEKHAWFIGNAREKTHPVGSKWPINDLYHMHGNVWEWVQDTYSPSLLTGSDPLREDEDPESKRVMRGGSWENYVRYLRSANRSSRPPDKGFPFLGFRLAKTL